MAKQLSNTRPDNSLIGAAGVHFVASELSRRGLIALPTIRNTAGFDIVAATPDGKWHGNIQVKTSAKNVKFWPVGTRYKSWHGRRNYYAFVRYLKREARFEVFVESADGVKRHIERHLANLARQGRSEWTPCWHLPQTELHQNRVRARWTALGIPRPEV